MTQKTQLREKDEKLDPYDEFKESLDKNLSAV